MPAFPQPGDKVRADNGPYAVCYDENGLFCTERERVRPETADSFSAFRLTAASSGRMGRPFRFFKKMMLEKKKEKWYT